MTKIDRTFIRRRAAEFRDNLQARAEDFSEFLDELYDLAASWPDDDRKDELEKVIGEGHNRLLEWHGIHRVEDKPLFPIRYRFSD